MRKFWSLALIFLSISLFSSSIFANIYAIEVVAASDQNLTQAQNTLDNDFVTYWSDKGQGVWVQYDLGSVKPFQSVRIAWYRGDERVATFDIETSNDGSSWQTAYSGVSSGTQLALETYNFIDEVAARYMRIVGYGNSVNDWSSITEVEIIEPNTYQMQVLSASDGNLVQADNTLDKDLLSYWSDKGMGAWISFELEAEVEVNRLAIAWYRGDIRRAQFDIEVSSDTIQWTSVFSGYSVEGSLQLENYNFFQSVSARYIRIVGYGNTANDWTSITEIETPFPGVIREDRGYITSIPELNDILDKANQNIEPFATNVTALLAEAGDPFRWDYGTVSGNMITVDINGSNKCALEPLSNVAAVEDKFIHFAYGGHTVYLKALAYHFSQDLDYGRSAIDKINQLPGAMYFGGDEYSGANQCILHLATSIVLWIQAADLLSGHPDWTLEDENNFKAWLANEVFHKVAWASRGRVSNWGSAGSLAAMAIADYVADYLANTGTQLNEVAPIPLNLTASDAYEAHKQMQIVRMSGQWEEIVNNGDGQCFDSVTNEYYSGIQTHGGIPDELRRGFTGCDGQWINLDQNGSVDSTALSYQIKHVMHLLMHAEMLLRRGDSSLYGLQVSTGEPAIEQAIRFVIDNPIDSSQSVDWHVYQKDILFAAYRYYLNPIILSVAETLTSKKGGAEFPYGRYTHEQVVGLPPIVPAP